MNLGSLLRPDLKSLVWLAAGYFLLGKLISVAKTKFGK